MTAPSRIQKKPRSKPTFKQKRFIAEYVKNNGNGTKAVMKVYNVKDRINAKAIAHQNLEKEVVQNGIQEALKRSKLTPDYVMDSLHETIDSSIGIKAKNADAIKGIDLLLKLYNAYPQKATIHKSMSVKYDLTNKNIIEAQEKLSLLADTTASLLAELKDS